MYMYMYVEHNYSSCMHTIYVCRLHHEVEVDLYGIYTPKQPDWSECYNHGISTRILS